ncbi:MAG: amidohydrolase family protein [Woeseiaceae bacterium]
MRRLALLAAFVLLPMVHAGSQESTILLSPDRVFDGERMHENWVLVLHGDRISYAGPEDSVDQGGVSQTLNLPGSTVLPGLIEGHSHILLHPYNETTWNDQVLKESEAERVARAVNHVRDSLLAGITTMRDLGSEGAGYADVGIRDSINKGIIPGPRLLVAGKAIVATGSYGPKGFHENVTVPLGAEVADGYDDLVRVVRSQIGRNIDFVKVYADYRWGPNGTAQPSFTQGEIETIVAVTSSSGRPVVAHASTAEAMRRAILAGVETIEHGDGATRETYQLMRENNVALCPTLAAGDAISQYGGWKKGEEPDPARIVAKRNSFKEALAAGVTICFGGDVGVYPHGDNVRELEMMVDYGMQAEDALRSATSVNADLFHIDEQVGRIRAGLIADIIAVRGDPSEDISALREISLVIKGGEIVRQEEGIRR